MKGYSEAAIEKALIRIWKGEERFLSISDEFIKGKINDIKFNSNGDLKNAIYSFYAFSLSFSKLQDITNIPTYIYNSKSKKIRGNKGKNLKAETKQDLSKL